MNTNYSKDIVINTLESYIKQIDATDDMCRDSCLKVCKSLKDTVNLINSLSDMNMNESNKYFELLMAAISSSISIK